jgi:hypothetical protein
MAVLRVGAAALNTDHSMWIWLPVVNRRQLKQIGNQRHLGKPKHKETATTAQGLRPS